MEKLHNLEESDYKVFDGEVFNATIWIRGKKYHLHKRRKIMKWYYWIAIAAIGLILGQIVTFMVNSPEPSNYTPSGKPSQGVPPTQYD